MPCRVVSCAVPWPLGLRCGIALGAPLLHLSGLGRVGGVQVAPVTLPLELGAVVNSVSNSSNDRQTKPNERLANLIKCPIFLFNANQTRPPFV